MAHKIIIMYDKGELSTGTPATSDTEGHRQALEVAASQIAATGHRFFKAVKALMLHNMELPNDVKEIGESQMLVLHTLVKGKQLTTDLAERFNVTNPTMTRIIDSLVHKGYVERQHALGDRRCIFLQLTQQGEVMGKRVEQHFRNAIIQFISPLSEEQLKDIVKAYGHLDSLLPDNSQDVEGIVAEASTRRRRAERPHRREITHHNRTSKHGRGSNAWNS